MAALIETSQYAQNADSSSDVMLPSTLTHALGKTLENLSSDECETIDIAASYLSADATLTKYTKNIASSLRNLHAFTEDLQTGSLVVSNTDRVREFYPAAVVYSAPAQQDTISLEGEGAKVVSSALSHHLKNIVGGLQSNAEFITRLKTVDMAAELDAGIIFNAAQQLMQKANPLISADSYTMHPNQPIQFTVHKNQEAA